MDPRDGVLCRYEDVVCYHEGQASTIASGLKKLINGDSKRSVFTQEEAAQRLKENVSSSEENTVQNVLTA